MKMDPLQRFLDKFHGKRLLLDTNLLDLYFVGSFFRVHCELPRRRFFEDDEFTLLAQIIQHFEKEGRVLTTPHLLTEVSNISERLRENQFAFLSFIRPMLRNLD